MQRLPVFIAALCAGVALGRSGAAEAVRPQAGNYPIVDTGQTDCFSEAGEQIACSRTGQDGEYVRNPPQYQLQGEYGVLDKVTNLEWARAPLTGVTFAEAEDIARASRLGGHDDWRVPTVKELYSLIDFRGGYTGDPATSRPYIDPVFAFRYGQGKGLGEASAGRRPIDVQEWSATRYAGLTMGRDATAFGVNFADGRIKGYPLKDPLMQMRTDNRLNLRLVRGPRNYGVNDFHPSGEVVVDTATGLVWQRRAAEPLMSWASALGYCEGLVLDGRSDWRLPNAKELQSIVDYSRIPALPPVFGKERSDAYFWTSTTHLESAPEAAHETRWRRGGLAVYVAFGPALGYMDSPPGSGRLALLDVHGAGSQRSDPKRGNPGDFAYGLGPQGDDVRLRNAVRCVADLR